MTRSRLYAAGLSAITLLVVAAAPLALAERGQAVSETTAETENEQAADSKTRLERIEAKRLEIQSRLDTMKQDRRAALDAKRLEACEKKSNKINSIIQKRSSQASKHLAVFTKISDRVQEFVADKSLTIENYDALVANIEDKEQAATAAIEANTNTVFDCDSVDASSPGKVVKASVNGVRDALKEYRTAIKDLIVKVKSNSAVKEDSSSDETSGTDASNPEANTDTSTGEGQ